MGNHGADVLAAAEAVPQRVPSEVVVCAKNAVNLRSAHSKGWLTCLLSGNAKSSRFKKWALAEAGDDVV